MMMNNVLRFSGCINSASVDAGKCGGKTMRNTQKINNNDILDALNVIKNVCKNHSYCCECPLRLGLVSNSCYILSIPDVPADWELNNNDEDNDWLAFIQEE